MKRDEKLEGMANKILTEKEYRDFEEKVRILNKILYGKEDKLTKEEMEILKAEYGEKIENEDDREVIRGCVNF